MKKTIVFILIILYFNFGFSQKKDTLYITFKNNINKNEGFFNQKINCTKNKRNYEYKFNIYNIKYKSIREEALAIGSLLYKRNLKFIYLKHKKKSKKDFINFINKIMQKDEFNKININDIISIKEIKQNSIDRNYEIFYDYFLKLDKTPFKKIIYSSTFKHQYYMFFKRYDIRKIYKNSIEIIDMDKKISNNEEYIKLFNKIENAKTIYIIGKNKKYSKKILLREVFRTSSSKVRPNIHYRL